uniref:NADH-ubiquinone oxidoreductase chain 6 n=1 Tax=Athalia tanaoserrula TaxID=2813725 RepID=A0A977TLE1_9HYME|nr:NADH dehydrogenase subunit 6 [Athalia tanaoserrula]UXW93578.1 NADH dehydrogenase subunit 6 [Athalia tanaoserrula]
MTKILLIFISLNSLMFYFSTTPLSMLLSLITQTLFITMMTGLMSMSFWYSYILFIILMGGMLILFIYINSLIPNQKFNMKMSYFMWLSFFFLMIMMFIYYPHPPHVNNPETMLFTMMEMETDLMLKLSMNKLYNKPTNYIMFLMINYLLLTLFIAVKIININMGPIRKNN